MLKTGTRVAMQRQEDRPTSMFSNPWTAVSEEWQGMAQDFAEPFRRDVAGTIGLLANPAAGLAAASALGLGLASHAFGFWLGAVAGTAQASQRLFAPEASGSAERAADVAARGTNQSGGSARKKPALKIVPRTQPQVAADQAVPVAPAEPAPAVAEAEHGPAVTEARQALVQTSAPEPKDFRKPAAIERPSAPDDLKAISGIGPKLEKVLNDLGVWTYAQIAAWGKPEIAWVDDYLAFRGRIERDGWIEQARSLSAVRKRGGN
jgi:NADH-quinone oxidoreductase subunit E